MDTFAKRVKDRRLTLRLSQGQVAALAGLKQPEVSKIERGRVRQTKEILGLARALECDADWLATGEGERTDADVTRRDRRRINATLEQTLRDLTDYMNGADAATRHQVGRLLAILADAPQSRESITAMLNDTLTPKPAAKVLIERRQKNRRGVKTTYPRK